MIRIYIAGPMTGHPDHNYPAFHAAENMLTAAGYTPINPAIHDLTRIRGWQFYIRQTLRMLLDADAIVLLPGWETSRGAQLERSVAISIGMPIHQLADLPRLERCAP